ARVAGAAPAAAAGAGPLLVGAGPRPGPDAAADAAPPERGGDRPPLGQRRVLVAAAAGLVLEVGDEAAPAVELPHVDDLGPPAGRADGRPHAEAELVPLGPGDRAPVGRHVLDVPGAVVREDVDELVDVDLGGGHAAEQDDVRFEGHSGRW